MGRRQTGMVRAIASLSVAFSVLTLTLSERAGRPLPSETINVAVIGAGAAVMAVLLQRRMPQNNLWRVLLVIAVNGPLALVLYAASLRSGQPPELLVAALWLLDVALAVPWLLFGGLFPDGHRPVRQWPAAVTLGALLLLGASLGAWLTASPGAPVPIPGHLPGAASGPWDGSVHAVLERIASVFTGLLPLAALAALAWRYSRTGPVLRQQIRVGAVGLAISVILVIALRILPGAQEGRMQVAVTVVAVGLGQLAVAAALLRWRLWVVDQALPRAVVLGACSAAFTGLIVAGALLLTGQVGKSQLRVAVVAAAVVTVFIQGYSRRMEPFVRRLVYGERPGGFAVLVGLADGLEALDEQGAAGRIADAAGRGLAVPWCAVWSATTREEVYRLTATTGTVDVAPTLVLPAAPDGKLAAARLLREGSDPSPWPAGTAAVVTLGPPETPWALLAVGQRRGDPLTGVDMDLLDAIARESELARSNRHLSDVVAANVEALEARAVQLQVSRQRLVAAQDEERRRIERDLHDGAQHELIALAGRLRQLARAPAIEPGCLDDLARQAERAVFTLQDLARGIYPSVLTDGGLVAAVRSLAGRLPMEVSLDAGADVLTRRWPAAVEVALYFVAVEALGNSRKHAHATSTCVALAERDGNLVLEVSDNGCGFDARTGSSSGGSGIQHMSDRLAALGGTLVIEAGSGTGTWVTASVPLIPVQGGGDLSDRWPTP